MKQLPVQQRLDVGNRACAADIALFICQSIDRKQIFDVTFETPPPNEKSCVCHCWYHIACHHLLYNFSVCIQKLNNSLFNLSNPSSCR